MFYQLFCLFAIFSFTLPFSEIYFQAKLTNNITLIIFHIPLFCILVGKASVSPKNVQKMTIVLNSIHPPEQFVCPSCIQESCYSISSFLINAVILLLLEHNGTIAALIFKSQKLIANHILRLGTNFTRSIILQNPNLLINIIPKHIKRKNQIVKDLCHCKYQYLLK